MSVVVSPKINAFFGPLMRGVLLGGAIIFFTVRSEFAREMMEFQTHPEIAAVSGFFVLVGVGVGVLAFAAGIMGIHGANRSYTLTREGLILKRWDKEAERRPLTDAIQLRILPSFEKPRAWQLVFQDGTVWGATLQSSTNFEEGMAWIRENLDIETREMRFNEALPGLRLPRWF